MSTMLPMEVKNKGKCLCFQAFPQVSVLENVRWAYIRLAADSLSLAFAFRACKGTSTVRAGGSRVT